MIFYCVPFDEFQRITSQSQQVPEKNSVNVIQNVFFLNLKFYYERENVRKKTKGKQDVNNVKGKTVPIFPAQKFIRSKRARLRLRRSKGKHFGKLSVKVLNLTIKQSYKAIKSFTFLCLPYPNPGSIGAKLFFNLSSMSKSLIDLLLQMGNLELNPGPVSNHQISKKTISIITYNCNGLGERKKTEKGNGQGSWNYQQGGYRYASRNSPN